MESIHSIPAVVLAGGVNTIPLYPGYQPGLKALLRYCGKTSIEYVLAALGAVSQIAAVSIVGPREELRHHVEQASAYEILPAGPSLSANVLKGLEHFAAFRDVLFVTADLPLLTPQSIAVFLEKTAGLDSGYEENMTLSVVPQHCYLGPYERLNKGFIHFKDAAICLGNLMLLDTRLRARPHSVSLLDRVYATRKDARSVARVLGPFIGLAFWAGVHVFHLLTLQQMARLISRRLEIGINPLLIEHPEISADVDEPRDYEFVEREMMRQVRPCRS